MRRWIVMRRHRLIQLILVGMFLVLGLTLGKTRTMAAAAEANYPDIKPGETALVERVYVDGIEFIFDKAYTVGKYENGDYWVYGVNASVWINEMKPAYNSETQSNGWEINPTVSGGQGFVGGEGTGFDARRITGLTNAAITNGEFRFLHPTDAATYTYQMNSKHTATFTLTREKGSVSNPIFGDMNDDGLLNIIDLSYIGKNVGKTNVDSDWASCKKADLNGNNQIDVADLLALAKLM